MNCRVGCGVCCVAISISSPIPGMPDGKPAGVTCIHLVDGLCGLFGDPVRPKICEDFVPTEEFCGDNKQEAKRLITALELLTKPSKS